MDRRRFFASLAGGATVALVAAGPAGAQQAGVLKVNGTVGPRNYKGLESFLFNSLDTVVGLRIAFPAGGGGTKGDLNVSVDAARGQFVAYLADDGESEIVATDGYAFQHGSYVFDGFFVVKSGGMHQGIVSLYLDEADEASVRLSGRPVTDIDIDRLDPAIRKQG